MSHVRHCDEMLFPPLDRATTVSNIVQLLNDSVYGEKNMSTENHKYDLYGTLYNYTNFSSPLLSVGWQNQCQKPSVGIFYCQIIKKINFLLVSTEKTIVSTEKTTFDIPLHIGLCSLCSVLKYPETDTF